ncbi:MAG: hypothetical protein FWG30_11625 [Eubacteriaceae bacterium]|nr:hypothetical protein [Eubacteriaceae bacterium]
MKLAKTFESLINDGLKTTEQRAINEHVNSGRGDSERGNFQVLKGTPSGTTYQVDFKRCFSERYTTYAIYITKFSIPNGLMIDSEYIGSTGYMGELIPSRL